MITQIEVRDLREIGTQREDLRGAIVACEEHNRDALDWADIVGAKLTEFHFRVEDHNVICAVSPELHESCI